MVGLKRRTLAGVVALLVLPVLRTGAGAESYHYRIASFNCEWLFDADTPVFADGGSSADNSTQQDVALLSLFLVTASRLDAEIERCCRAIQAGTSG